MGSNPVTVLGRQRIVTEDLAMNAVSPGFFAALGVPMLRGRDFAELDRKLPSAIVNQAFVEKYLPGQDPLLVRLAIGDGPEVVADDAIVGVVQNFHDFALRREEPEVFFAFFHGRATQGTFYVRSRAASTAAIESIRSEVRRLDPALTVLSLRPTVDDQLDRMLINERLLATLAGGFAAVATLLAMIGLYGVLSFSAASRTREIGIRLALGAPRRAASGLIVREAAILTAVGIAIALPASWALGRLVESQLFGVRPTDAVTLIGAAGVPPSSASPPASRRPRRRQRSIPWRPCGGSDRPGALFLLVPESHRRIDAQGASRRQAGGEDRRGDDQQEHRQVSPGSRLAAP